MNVSLRLGGRGSGQHLRRPLAGNAFKVRLHGEVGVVLGRAETLRELVHGGLSGRVRLTAVRRPQELRREGGALVGAAVAELDDV